MDLLPVARFSEGILPHSSSTPWVPEPQKNKRRKENEISIFLSSFIFLSSGTQGTVLLITQTGLRTRFYAELLRKITHFKIFLAVIIVIHFYDYDL